MLIQTFKTVVFERYATFEGRARRDEFWWFVLANFLISAALSITSQFGTIFAIVYGIVMLALLVPSIAVTVRRLHDTGRSGMWILIGLVPLVGFIVLIVFLAAEGTPDANEYGPANAAS